MDENLADFASITGASTTQAEQYLRLTDGNLEQAIQLFFEDPNLATSTSQPAASSRPPPSHRTDDEGVIHIDSDEEITDAEPSGGGGRAQVDVEDDEAIARRLQEEMYGATAQDSVRAPMARTTETLVGDEDDYADGDTTAMVHEQMRRQQMRGRLGVFNQREMPSNIWTDSEARARNLSMATGGASSASRKSNMLAEMFRPPFEIISRLNWDQARDEGRESEKWLLVNVQDPSIFDCQALNRDIWKNKEIMECIKEHFIFIQYLNNDPRGQNYFSYYFQNMVDNPNAYPHIAIVDPRTGEQVKSWTGPPVPQANDFLMQLYEFLDRYSLKEGSRNPVAKRKNEVKHVDALTEDEQLERAIAASLQNGNNSDTLAVDDPDELTKSVNMGKGKGRADDLIDLTDEPSPAPAPTEPTPVPDSAFARIASDRPHEEPAADPAATTRIQFRYSGGRQVRRFALGDPVRRIYEWLKAAPIEGQEGVDFELIFMGKNLIEAVEQTVEEAGLKNGSVMVEFLGSDD